jgi:hypothetical protein
MPKPTKPTKPAPKKSILGPTTTEALYKAGKEREAHDQSTPPKDPGSFMPRTGGLMRPK